MDDLGGEYNEWSQRLLEWLEARSRRLGTRLFFFPLTWAVVLGGVGLVCGFFGPMFLSDSNLGPLLGIFFTGPLGFLSGLVLGVVTALLLPSVRANAWCLGVLACLGAVGTLYLVTDDPIYAGKIIDAEVRGCRDPALLITDSMEKMEGWVREAPEWREVRPDWRQDAGPMLEKNDGVVLDLHVFAERKIYKQRKPWNRGTLRAEPWSQIGTETAFFSRESGSSCDDYVIGKRRLHSVVWEASGQWPPDTLPSFLRLDVVERVPRRFADLIAE